MVDDVAAGDGHAHRSAVADVAEHELDIVGAVVGGRDVEHADPVAAAPQSLAQQRPEVAAATRDQAGGHSSSPCSTHQRMLRRMPSSSATAGS